ncbi:MAG: type II toxin-antitoxin system prevent-host-death family antitoxin [Aestuariivirga sp.]|nr:type II toxin-antitoxin system prevent-host-death family antitoxin [Aestuariivirga sp.]
MVRVSAGELQRQWGRIQDMALAEPVTVTSNGRDRMVLLSTEEYNRLKRRDREVMTLADFTDADIAAIKKVKPSTAASAFDREMET